MAPRRVLDGIRYHPGAYPGRHQLEAGFSLATTGHSTGSGRHPGFVCRDGEYIEGSGNISSEGADKKRQAASAVRRSGIKSYGSGGHPKDVREGNQGVSKDVCHERNGDAVPPGA